jgi:hypothetical protein
VSSPALKKSAQVPARPCACRTVRIPHAAWSCAENALATMYVIAHMLQFFYAATTAYGRDLYTMRHSRQFAQIYIRFTVAKRPFSIYKQ